MRLIVAREFAYFRAWVTEHGETVELPGVENIIGWDEATAKKMGYPTDVHVRFAYGSITMPRELVTVKGDGLPQLGDGTTIEGAQ